MWMVPGSLAIGSTELVPGEVREHLHLAGGRAQSVPPEKLEQIETTPAGSGRGQTRVWLHPDFRRSP